MTDLANWRQYMSDEDFNNLINYIETVRTCEYNTDKKILCLYGSKTKNLFSEIEALFRLNGDVNTFNIVGISKFENIKTNKEFFDSKLIIMDDDGNGSSIPIAKQLTSSDYFWIEGSYDQRMILSKFVICIDPTNKDLGFKYREIPITIT